MADYDLWYTVYLNDMYTHRYIDCIYLLCTCGICTYIYAIQFWVSRNFTPKKGQFWKSYPTSFFRKDLWCWSGFMAGPVRKTCAQQRSTPESAIRVHPGRQKQSKATISQDVERSTDTAWWLKYIYIISWEWQFVPIFVLTHRISVHPRWYKIWGINNSIMNNV